MDLILDMKKEHISYGISKLRLTKVKSNKNRLAISVIDLSNQVKGLRLMVIELYFFSLGLIYYLTDKKETYVSNINKKGD